MIQDPGLAALGGIAVCLLAAFLYNRVNAIIAWKRGVDHVQHDVKHLESITEMQRDNLRRDIRDTDAEVRKLREELVLQINGALQSERQHTDAMVDKIRRIVDSRFEEMVRINKEFRATFETIGDVHATQSAEIARLKDGLNTATFHLQEFERGIKADREDLTLLGTHLNVKFRNKYSTRELYQTTTEKQTR